MKTITTMFEVMLSKSATPTWSGPPLSQPPQSPSGVARALGSAYAAHQDAAPPSVTTPTTHAAAP